MAGEEVGGPKRQFDDLDDELAGGLRHSVGAEAAAVPLSGPPGAVRFIVLELAREEDGDEDLVDSTLDEDDADEAKDGMRDVPELEEPLQADDSAWETTTQIQTTHQELEEANQTNDAQRVSDERHD